MCLCTICVLSITTQQYVLIYNMYLTSLCTNMHFYTIHVFDIGLFQGGITCGAIDEPRKSSKAIDERVIINFRYR